VRISKELWKHKSENLKRLILLSDSARWPATPTNPCTALTQKGLSSPIFESRLNCILTQWMFVQAKLISENRLCQPKSIKRSSNREHLETSSYEKTATNSAIHCQSNASLQSSAIQSKHNHFNFGAPQFPGTACMQPLFLCPPRHEVSLYSYHFTI